MDASKGLRTESNAVTVRFPTAALLNVDVRVGYFVSIQTSKRLCTITCAGCLATVTVGQPGFSVPVYVREKEMNIIHCIMAFVFDL